MENLDAKPFFNNREYPESEDDLFIEGVIQDDHELYFLHVCLDEICRMQEDEQFV